MDTQLVPIQPSPAPAADFPLAESALVKALGVARRFVREKRAELTEGTDFALVIRHGAREIHWSRAGEARLRALLGLPPCPDPVSAEKAPPAPATTQAGPLPVLTEAAPAENAPAELTVARGPWPGRPTLLSCFGPGGSAHDRSTWVTVRVARSEHFVPGMRLRAEPEPARGHGVWRYLGPPAGQPGHPGVRYPRARGRW